MNKTPKINYYLVLFKWIITNTSLTTDKTMTNNEIKNRFFKEYPETKNVLNSQIGLLIGYCLKIVYGSDLLKESGGGRNLKYNIIVVEKPVCEIIIKDL